MPKITAACNKKLKKLEDKKPRLTKQISNKLQAYDFETCGRHASLKKGKDMRVVKLYLTTPYGPFRLIIIDSTLIDIVLVDVYAKNSKEDLTPEEYKKLNKLLLEAEKDAFWEDLEEL